MEHALLLLGTLGFLAIVGSFKATSRLNAKLAARVSQRPEVSKTISALVLLAQASELVRVVEHANFVTVVSALLLMAVWAGNRSGAENHKGS